LSVLNLTNVASTLARKAAYLKCQLVIEQATGRVVCTFFGKGRRHDFKLFQASGVHFHPETVESLQDKGYQGIQSCMSTVVYLKETQKQTTHH